jgi:hypothetical protein
MDFCSLSYEVSKVFAALAKEKPCIFKKKPPLALKSGDKSRRLSINSFFRA